MADNLWPPGFEWAYRRFGTWFLEDNNSVRLVVPRWVVWYSWCTKNCLIAAGRIILRSGNIYRPDSLVAHLESGLYTPLWVDNLARDWRELWIRKGRKVFTSYHYCLSGHLICCTDQASGVLAVWYPLVDKLYLLGKSEHFKEKNFIFVFNSFPSAVNKPFSLWIMKWTWKVAKTYSVSESIFIPLSFPQHRAWMRAINSVI